MIKFESLHSLAPFAHPYTLPGGHICIPDGVFGIEANAIWGVTTQVCPYASIGEVPRRVDVEGCQSMGVGLGENERGVIWGHDHTIGEGASIGYTFHQTIRGNKGKNARGKLASRKVEAEIANVGVASPVHDQVASGIRRELTQSLTKY